MNHREEFKKWVLRNFAENSGAGPAYLASLDWLSERFHENNKIIDKSIFEIENISRVSELHKEVKEIQRDKSSYIYNKDAPSYGERYFYSASLAKYKEFLEQRLDSKIIPPFKKLDLKVFLEGLITAGLLYSRFFILRFSASLLTKSFLILTGLSGSGKTKIAQAFSLWICQDKDQRKIIPVGADWTNREPLLGYPNALNPNEYVKPENGALDLLIEANENPDLPYFLILDEMNLSHVERYFADFLSAMESGEEIFLHCGAESISGVPPKIRIPKNLFIIGTVNIDETTHMFSPKVLDRANTIEFRITPDEMSTFLDQVGEINMDNLVAKGSGMAKSFLQMALDKSIPSEGMESVKSELGKFFVELKKVGAEFGYRSATEILKLIGRLGKIDPTLSPEAKLDIAIVQKLLPKLHGSRRKLAPVLTALANLCLNESIQSEKENTGNENKVFEVQAEKIKYPISHEKLSRMYKAAIENGFASFAEA